MKTIIIDENKYVITELNLDGLIRSGVISELPSIRRHTGQYYRIEDSIYLLALIDCDHVVLVSLDNGNRFTIGLIKVKDSLNISQDEWRLIVNNKTERMNLLPIKVEVVEIKES